MASHLMESLYLRTDIQLQTPTQSWRQATTSETEKDDRDNGNAKSEIDMCQLHLVQDHDQKLPIELLMRSTSAARRTLSNS
jgi:hypothetical protein